MIDPNLDWLVLLSNNIINYESEWPMDQVTHNNYVLNKYGSYEIMYDVHHYETREIQDGNGNVILEKGLIVTSRLHLHIHRSSTGSELLQPVVLTL